MANYLMLCATALIYLRHNLQSRLVCPCVHPPAQFLHQWHQAQPPSTIAPTPLGLAHLVRKPSTCIKWLQTLHHDTCVPTATKLQQHALCHYVTIDPEPTRSKIMLKILLRNHQCKLKTCTGIHCSSITEHTAEHLPHTVVFCCTIQCCPGYPSSPPHCNGHSAQMHHPPAARLSTLSCSGFH